MLPNLDKESVTTIKASKDACLTACSTETSFVCRSVEYNYITNDCYLSQFDRRSGLTNRELVDYEAVDYFENSCLECKYFFFF